MGEVLKSLKSLGMEEIDGRVGLKLTGALCRGREAGGRWMRCRHQDFLLITHGHCKKDINLSAQLTLGFFCKPRSDLLVSTS